MNNLGFHHIALEVPNYDEVKKFYVEGLGFELTKEWGAPDRKCCMMQMGDGGCIELFGTGTPEACPTARFVHLALKSEDPAADYEKALAAGATSRAPEKDVPLNTTPVTTVRIAFVFGLAGEIIEFFKEV